MNLFSVVYDNAFYYAWFGLFMENNNTDVFAWIDGTELVRVFS